jgi:hypothetical protein
MSSMRSILAELSPAERNCPTTPVSTERRERVFPAVRLFRLSRKDLRQFAGPGRALWFVTVEKGSETDHHGSARTPSFYAETLAISG